MKMRLLFGTSALLWFSLHFLHCSFAFAKEKDTPPSARKGLLDLREWDFATKGAIRLQGNWAFYWKRLLSPIRKSLPPPTGYLPIPALWNQRKLGKTTLQSNGYGTYRLVLLLKTPQVIGLRLNRLYSAYRLYANGRLVHQHGRVGKTLSTATMKVSPATLNIHAPRRLELLIHTSNYFHRKGGPAEPVFLGTTQQIQQRRIRGVAMDVFSFAFAFIMFLYYAILYLLLRRSTAPLLFSMVCLTQALRFVLINEALLWWLFPSMPYVWLLRLEYSLVYLFYISGLALLRSFFPDEFPEKVIRWFIVPWSLLVVTSLTLPPAVFTRLFWVGLAFTFAAAIVAFAGNFRALLNQRDGSAIVFFGFTVATLAGLRDNWMYSQYQELGVEWTPIGVIVLIICQAMLLARRFSHAFDTVESLARELRSKNKHLMALNAAAARFVPENILKMLGKEDLTEVQLSDVVRTEMAILFADIRGFTTLSEGMTPRENFEFVNDMMGRIGPEIHKEEGIIIKYLGDGLMAVFPNGVRSSLKASIEILRGVHEYNREHGLEGNKAVRFGIGLNYGSMMLGMMGEWNRIQGDVLSDAVNLGARVEGMTKKYGVELLLTHTALEALESPEEFQVRLIDRVKPKGKNVPVTVYEVFDADPIDRIAKKKATREKLHKSIALYQKQEFVKATKILSEALQQDPEDRALQLYLERCQERARLGQSSDWDGIEVLKSK